MIFSLFAAMVFSALLSIKGIFNFILFLPFIIWSVVNFKPSINPLGFVLIILFFIYCTLHLIIFGGVLTYYLQYIVILMLSYTAFSQPSVHVSRITAGIGHFCFLIIFAFLIFSYLNLDMRLVNVNTSAFILLMYFLVYFKTLTSVFRGIWVMTAFASLSRSVWLILLVYTGIFRARKFYVFLLTGVIFLTVPWWFTMLDVDKQAIIKLFDFTRFKAGGGGSDFRRFFYYPGILIQSLELQDSSIWFGEGMGKRSYTTLLERKSDGLHNTFLIIVSDIGFVGLIFILAVWIVQCFRYFSHIAFIKFFILFSAIVFTPVLFGMPGILLALRFVGSAQYKQVTIRQRPQLARTCGPINRWSFAQKATGEGA